MDANEKNIGTDGEVDIPEMNNPEFTEDDVAIQMPPPNIVAFNELRSCADLVRMYKKNNLDLHPDFQRDIVWSRASQTRFIDSLMKQLPIPSMCLAFDYKREEWIVIDGLQRIRSIINFLDDEAAARSELSTLSTLDDIDPRISGKKLEEFKTGKLMKLRNRVEDKTLPITVLRCDFSEQENLNYIFTIFHRLNSGGVKLNNQEIRNCIFSGTFNDLLKELDLDPVWRKFNNMRDGENYRFVKQEIILRFFVFLKSWKDYDGRLASFLNKRMNERRNPDKKEIGKNRRLFAQVMGVAERISFGEDKRQVAVIESLLVGIGANIRKLTKKSDKQLTNLYREMRESESFKEEKLLEGISSKKRLTSRMETAINIFSK